MNQRSDHDHYSASPLSPGARQLLAITGAVALLLLGTSTFLLWRLVDQGGEPGRPAAGGEAPPPLPPSGGGGTARELLKELDRTQGRLSKPLRELRAELRRATRSSASLETLPTALQSLSQSAAGFGDLPSALRSLAANTAGLAGAGGDLEAIALESRRLARVQRLLAAMLREVRLLRPVRRTLRGMGRSLRSTVALFSRLNDSVDDMKTTLRQIKESLDETNACLKNPVCRR